MTSKKHSSKPATIYDVAERAGVSHITVSRVVNSKQNVSPKTRERVQKAMEELQYTPNAIAQTLQTRRSRTIELITTSSYGSHALKAISGVAQKHEFQFSILPTTVNELPNVLQTIPNRMVAGSILYAQEVGLDYAAVQRVIKQHPLVHMGGALQSGLPCVAYDQKSATERALQHLIELGHRRIGFITGELSLIDGEARYEAYLQTMRRNALEAGPIGYGNFNAHSGEKAMTEIIESGIPFTAVFVSSDEMAFGAIHQLHQAGLRVPQDVSIIGYDNTDFSPYCSPPLTTITNDLLVLGRIATEYLFELIETPEMPHHQRLLQAELIVRESTGRLGPSVPNV